MSAVGVLATAFAHHGWATLRLLDACAALDEGQLERDVPGTFGPVIDTLRHIVGADVGYLSVLAGMAPIDEDTMGVAELRAVAAVCAAAWQDVVGSDTAGSGVEADRVITRQRADGSSGSAPMAVRLAQALHHGSDHRSQVCTALTTLGVEPPAIDVWDHASERGAYVETDAD